MKFRLINGRVFDPTQNLNNVKKDIYVEDGLIVDPKINEKKEFKKSFDVSDMVVMAGAIDIHSHIAGGNVNTARMLMPEIHKKFTEKMLNNRKHLPSRGSRWTSDGTGFRYAEMGCTTVIEPAVLPIYSLVSHLELENIHYNLHVPRRIKCESSILATQPLLVFGSFPLGSQSSII